MTRKKLLIRYAYITATVALMLTVHLLTFGEKQSSVDVLSIVSLSVVATVFGVVSYALTRHVILPNAIFACYCVTVPLYSEYMHTPSYFVISASNSWEVYGHALVMALSCLCVSLLSSIASKLYCQNKEADIEKRPSPYFTLFICATAFFMHFIAWLASDKMRIGGDFWLLFFIMIILPILTVSYGIVSLLITRRVLLPACINFGFAVFYSALATICEALTDNKSSFGVADLLDGITAVLLVSLILTVITLIISAIAAFFARAMKEDEDE